MRTSFTILFFYLSLLLMPVNNADSLPKRTPEPIDIVLPIGDTPIIKNPQIDEYRDNERRSAEMRKVNAAQNTTIAKQFRKMDKMVDTIKKYVQDTPIKAVDTVPIPLPIPVETNNSFLYKLFHKK